MSARTSLHFQADVAIIGTGFAGSLTALALRRLGRSVVMLERGRHPRFAIGESSTPLANLLLEQLCDRYDLGRVRAFAKWGTWQRTHPEIACGLKRGFSFYHHTPGELFVDDARHATQLLVAASPHDAIADTHWYRPDFDAWLVNEAQQAGARYVDGVALAAMTEQASGVLLEGTRIGAPLSVDAAFVIDASGPRGCLHRLLRLEEMPMRWLPGTEGLYAHFVDVDLWENVLGSDPFAAKGDHGGSPLHSSPLSPLSSPLSPLSSSLAPLSSPLSHPLPPYPVDDAALHHVFPGGWIWVLRFNNGITSAGAALTDDLAASVGLSDGAAAWSRLLDRLPSVRAQFARATAVTPFTYARRVAFRSQRVTGARWALLPSAAGVIDPLLSTGFPLTLLGIHRLVEHLARHWGAPELSPALEDYADRTQRELDATEQLVAALYASMGDVELFKRLSLLYFAASSFSETVRRLGRDERASGFLLCDEPAFGPELRACATDAMSSPSGAARDALLARIDRAIEPFDVAGLGDRTRRDWYPVRAGDLMQTATKLGATREEILLLLERCGLSAPRRALSEPHADEQHHALHRVPDKSGTYTCGGGDAPMSSGVAVGLAWHAEADGRRWVRPAPSCDDQHQAPRRVPDKSGTYAGWGRDASPRRPSATTTRPWPA